MKPPFFAAVLALLLPFATTARADSALLDKVILYPGSYAQVCDVMSAPPDLPYRAYQLSGFAGASFSEANLAAMKQDREALVKAIRTRLLEIDLVRKAEDTKKDPAPEASFDGEDVGCDPKVLSPLLLDVIWELKAIEALPELLALEAKLVKGIATAKDDGKVAPPTVGGWHVAEERENYDENEPETKRDRRVQLFQSRVAQRDLVVLTGKLLREKNYAPYMATSLEKAYVKGLEAEAKERGISDYKPGDKFTGDKEYLQAEIRIDPVSKIPMTAYTSVAVPYSRESRDEIRAVAEKWIKENG